LLIAETTSINQDTFTHAIGVLVPSFCACTAFLYLFYPLAGYLADTRCGRYKTIIYSLSSFTILFLVAVVIVIVVTVCSHLLNTVSYSFLALLLPPFPSYIFFSANVIQFGMDQLYDSPMEDSVLFIHWFVLTSYLAFVFFKALALVIVPSAIGLVILGLRGVARP
jgi:dipeptide/tripeptide permease